MPLILWHPHHISWIPAFLFVKAEAKAAIRSQDDLSELPDINKIFLELQKNCIAPAVPPHQ